MATEEVGKFDNIIYVVAVFDVIRLVDHADIVKDVVFSHHKL